MSYGNSRIGRRLTAAVLLGIAPGLILQLDLASAQQPARNQKSVQPDFDRAALERLVSGRDAAARAELRREAAVSRQLDLQYYLPWRSGIGPGSYYWGAPYYGPAYPGITASFSAGAFYGRAYEPVTNITAPSGQYRVRAAMSNGAQSNLDEENERASDAESQALPAADPLPQLSTAQYGPYGIGGAGLAGSFNPLFAGLPGWLNAFEPSPFIPGFIYGYPYVGAVEQPLGHRILSAGARGYIYEPVFGSDLVEPTARNLPQAEQAAEIDASVAIENEQQAAADQTLAGDVRQQLSDALAAFQRQSYAKSIKLLESLHQEELPNYAAEVLRAQACFAAGDYEQAHKSLHAALSGLPESEWGMVVENYLDYYLLDRPFELQLRALEKFVRDRPDNAGARFVLGYEYGYLGYPAEAAEQLRQVVQAAPADRIAKRLFARFTAMVNQQQAGLVAAGEDPRLPAFQPNPPRGADRGRLPAFPKPEGVNDGPREF